MVALLLAALLQSTAPVSSIIAETAIPERAAKPDKDGLVCKKEAFVGSRIKSRACARKSAMTTRKNDDRDLVEKAQALQTIKQ
jgi:hypothetical protein